MKVALVYDRVNKWGGAERVLLALKEIFPDAPLYTSVYNPQTASWAEKFKIIPSFLQKFPLAKSQHEIYPLLMPLAFESFSFNQYDLVISVSSEAAKGVLNFPKTLHLCYCLTPTRYLWSGYEEYFNSSFKRIISRPFVKYLRTWDKIAAQRPDHYLAISGEVQKRIKYYYQRESEVIYPPVDTQKFFPKRIKDKKRQKDDYFLIVSRLVSYKRLDLAIKAFNQLGWNLKIAGIGRKAVGLKSLAKKNIQFLGELTDNQLVSYYQSCQAVVFPQKEDFGLVPLEAQACGRPVIAYKEGGALETVREGKTGLFFYPQTTGALIKTLKKFKRMSFKETDCQQQAEKFNKNQFKEKFLKLVEEKWQNP